MQTTQIVEALLFASDAPLTAADLARADESLDEDAVEAAVQELRAYYEANERAYQIYELAGGYQILTLPDFAPYLERFATVPQSSKLSQAALEALAVIAYRQPIDRSEVEEIRGVASSGVLRTLQDRGLIDVVGRGEGLGRPMLYGTTPKFLEHFGFRSLDDLPRSEELPVVLTGVEPPPLRRADDPAGLIEPDARAEAQVDEEAAALAGRETVDVAAEPSLDEAADAIVALASSRAADLDADGIDFQDGLDDGVYDDHEDDEDRRVTGDPDAFEFGADDDMDGPVEDDLAPLADEDEDTTTSRFTSAP